MDVMQQKNPNWEECRKWTEEIWSTWSTWAAALKYGLALEGLYGSKVGSVLECEWQEGAAARSIAL